MEKYSNLGCFFTSIAKKHKEKPALIYENQEVSYEELDRLSNQIARFFKRLNVKNQDVVAILNNKSKIGFASMLACLKIGAIYTNIDTFSPKTRVENILKSANPKIVIKDIDDCMSIEAIYVDEKIVKNFDDSFLDEKVEYNDIAYVMYTSGSTGIPKGVMITHFNVLSFLSWSINRFGIGVKDRFAGISPIYFDNSVFDFYNSLFSGASLVPISLELLKKPLELVQYIDSKKCTIWFSVPTLLIYLLTLKVLDGKYLQSIRSFIFGGEGFFKSELKKLYDLYKNNAKFINVYGPTECTCICSTYDVKKSDFIDMLSLVSLGKITDNFNYKILNKDGELSKKGELFLFGDGVGMGYIGNKELTKEKFIPQKMYKTGDIVEEKNGFLHFIGRVDNQIKHMGYRIELEEIEIALNSLDYVVQSAVLYRRENSRFGKLIAFVECCKNISLQVDIRVDLKSILPTYMIPDIIKFLEVLPKNRNGKIDKQKLKEEYNCKY